MKQRGAESKSRSGSPERPQLLAANWKQHMRWADCEAYVGRLRTELPEYFDAADAEHPVELLVLPPAPYIPVLGDLLHDSAVLLGAQDVSVHREGAHTGEVAAEMLADVGCDYCVVGHSERRAMGESSEKLRQKLKALRLAEVTPVLCVGEPLEIRRAGEAAAYVTGQLEELRSELAQTAADTLVIAYEPIWAIGTGENAEPEDAQEMAAFIRGWLAHLSAQHAETVQVLYGGSVNPENLERYLALEDIDGALIGGASLQADGIVQMVRMAQGLLHHSAGAG